MNQDRDMGLSDLSGSDPGKDSYWLDLLPSFGRSEHIHKTLEAPNQLGASPSVELRGVLPKSKARRRLSVSSWRLVLISFWYFSVGTLCSASL